MLIRYARYDRKPEPRIGSRLAALTAQHFCSIEADKTLSGRDGTSKTMVWKNCAASGELRTCGNVPLAACRCHRIAGLWITHDTRRR